MQHPDEGTVHAWLDGQLSANDAASFEAHVTGCAGCSAVVAEARGLIAASSRIVSALDVVPGGVMPIHKRLTRPWHATTQVRAAAAILFVAGASLLVLDRRDSMRPRENASRVPAAPAMEAAQDVPQPVEVNRVPQQQRAEQKKGSPPADQESTSKQVAATERDLSMRSAGPEEVSKANRGIVTTGVAMADAATTDEPTLIRSDSTGRFTVTVYRTANGVEVTLTESIPASFSTSGAAQPERRTGALSAEGPRQLSETVVTGEASQAKAAPPPPASAREDSVKPPPIASIMWTDPVTKRIYILSGRVSRENLEDVRAKLEQKKH